MWRRALLAAAAVSYLICVLIMSGMQKEDLDVSMLRKLQRYNVNIDDINNEKLRQQCCSRNNDFTTGVLKENIKEDNVSTTAQSTSTIITETALPNDFNMDTVLNYLKAQQDAITIFDETTTTRMTTKAFQNKTTSATEAIEKQGKIDMTLLHQYIKLKTQKRSLHKRDKISEIIKQDESIHLKTKEKYPKVSEDVAFFNEMFKSFQFLKQTIPTTTAHPTKAPIDAQNIYKQIDDLMKNGDKMEHGLDGSNPAFDVEAKTVENFIGKATQSNTNHYITNTDAFLSLNQNRSHLARNRLLKSFYNFLSEMNQFNNESDQLLPGNKMLSTEEPLIQHNREIYPEMTTFKSKSEIESYQKPLTPNLVKEIAETVKEVIIKDLRNELSNIYLKTTLTTTDTTPTTTKMTTITSSTEKLSKKLSQITTSNSRTQESDASIMDKFMDLYEQIKTLKQVSVLPKPTSEAEDLMKETKQEIKYREPVIMPIRNKIQIPQSKVFVPSIGKYNTKQSINQDPYIPKEKIRAVPITIQTNSVEIQPLAVPVFKPQSLIGQNIIVEPSGYRFQGKEYQRPKQNIVKDNRYPDTHLIHKNRTYKHTPMKLTDKYTRNPAPYNPARYPIHVRSQEVKQRDDIIRFRLRDDGNSRFDMDYYEKLNFGHDRRDPNEKHGSFGNRYIPRYHERLERVDMAADDAPIVYDKDKIDRREQSNIDIPPRQQLSLIGMKRGSNYNDSHFKNFLKTQQKVTDILEKILAARPKTNTPRSVEAV